MHFLEDELFSKMSKKLMKSSHVEITLFFRKMICIIETDSRTIFTFSKEEWEQQWRTPKPPRKVPFFHKIAE
jgi:hypothetical protein